MKPTEFIVENSIIAQEADDMHRDHEVQMARSQLYSAAQAAIQIHKMLKNVSEMEGLEGWVQTKIAVASEYLESVQDYLKYEQVSQESEMMPFAEAAADYALNELISKKVKEQSSAIPQIPALPPTDGELNQGERVYSNPDGTRSYAGAFGKFTYDKSGKAREYSAPDLGGLSQRTNLDTGEKTTTVYTGDMAASTTPRRDQSTVKTAMARVGPNTVDMAQGIGFGGAGKDVQQGGNQVVSITNPQNKTHSFAGRVPSSQEIGSSLNEKNKKLKETATGGGSSSGGIATSLSGPGHKKTSGVPKKLGNAHKPKRVEVGKGVY